MTDAEVDSIIDTAATIIKGCCSSNDWAEGLAVGIATGIAACGRTMTEDQEEYLQMSRG